MLETDRGRVVLRIQDNSRDTVLHWLGSVEGVAVPRPIPLRTGALSGHLGERRHFQLSEWVEGERVTDAKEFVQLDRLRALGATVARLHASAERFGIPDDSDLEVVDADSIFGDGAWLDVVPAERVDEARENANAVEACLRDLPRAPTTFGIIHADLEPQNWVFHDDEPRPIDFGEGCIGFYLYDLLGVTWTHTGWPGYPEYQEALVAGYESVRAIPAEGRPHLDAIQTACLFNWIRFVATRGRPELREYVPVTLDAIRKLIDGRRV